MANWGVFKGGQEPHDGITALPPAPPWRAFNEVGTESPAGATTHRGATYQVSPEEVEAVNAALYLRRPLLVTGRPGVGKSSLAYAVAYELQLGDVLTWSITTRTTLQDGLYSYDAIGRLQDVNLQRLRGEDAFDPADLGRFIRLGPLGTALLATDRPRVLLVDEIDKSDVDLPNDLLHIFEEGQFVIPELARLPPEVEKVEVTTWDNHSASISRGRVYCRAFPFVVFTSNNEREFPPAFLRRCLRITVQPPGPERIEQIVLAHLEQELGAGGLEEVRPLINEFLRRRDTKRDELATDQLLNAIYLATQQINPLGRERLIDLILQSLSG